jgi:DNA-directed RNA polymerase subunit omega
MNSELTKHALAKVGNPNVLVNIISRRVRQLTTGGGANSRPLIADTAGMGAADIALTELLEDKIGYELVMAVENGEHAEKSTSRKKKKK